jgi:hypothetical protein
MAKPLPSLEELSPGLKGSALTGRLTQVLRFARINVANLDRHAPFWPEEKAGIVNQADKVVVETALLSLLASRVSGAGTPLDAELAALVSLVAPLARSESNQVRLLRFPQTAASIGIGHVCLSALGNRHDAFDALMRRAVSSGHVDAIERLPYRAMDLAWLRAVHNPNEPPRFQGAMAHSILRSCAHPVYMAEMDAYAITHALMYLTDFGARGVPDDVSYGRVSDMVDACLAWQLLTANMDLMGELLVGAALLGGAWSPYARLAMRMLIAVWDEFGFLPSSAFDVERYRAVSGDEASAYAFHHVYHTTYVAGILCQILLRCPERRERPEAWTHAVHADSSLLSRCEDVVRAADAFCSLRGSDRRGDTAELPKTVAATLERTTTEIHKYPSACGRPDAPWTAAVAANGAVAPAELALVLNDALLIHAAREYNLPVLVAALLERAASSLPLSRTLLEATAFLCGQQMPCGAIGAYFVLPENCSSPQSTVVTATFADCVSRLLRYLRAQNADLVSPQVGPTPEKQHGSRRADKYAVRLDKQAGDRHQPAQGRSGTGHHPV